MNKIALEIEAELIQEGKLQSIIIPPMPNKCSGCNKEKNGYIHNSYTNNWYCFDCSAQIGEMEAMQRDTCQYCFQEGTSYPICPDCLEDRPD